MERGHGVRSDVALASFWRQAFTTRCSAALPTSTEFAYTGFYQTICWWYSYQRRLGTVNSHDWITVARKHQHRFNILSNTGLLYALPLFQRAFESHSAFVRFTHPSKCCVTCHGPPTMRSASWTYSSLSRHRLAQGISQGVACDENQHIDLRACPPRRRWNSDSPLVAIPCPRARAATPAVPLARATRR